MCEDAFPGVYAETPEMATHAHYPQPSGVEIPEAYWPASLAAAVSARFSVRPRLPGIRQGVSGKDTDIPFWPPLLQRACTHTLDSPLLDSREGIPVSFTWL